MKQRLLGRRGSCSLGFLQYRLGPHVSQKEVAGIGKTILAVAKGERGEGLIKGDQCSSIPWLSRREARVLRSRHWGQSANFFFLLQGNQSHIPVSEPYALVEEGRAKHQTTPLNRRQGTEPQADNRLKSYWGGVLG